MSDAEAGRVVVVTGANGGIGYHMLRTLAADGYRVAGLDVAGKNVESLTATYPDRVRFYDCDVSDADAVDAAVAAVVDAWGRIDVLVNNAAVAEVASFDAQADAAVRREFDVNYFGYRNAIRAVLPQMRAQGGGIVHNVSSGTALAGHPGLTGYASTKGAIEAFTRSLRVELRDENVTCTLMQPPTTRTGLTAALDYPEWMVNDPADVGRKLARKIESTDRVVFADLQTRAGLYCIRRFPGLWQWATERFTPLPE